MTAESSPWLLVFDDGCPRCRSLADSVRAACDGKLEIRPLLDPQVRRWASRARPGRPMEWAPTLFRVDDTSVAVWTGRGLAVRLLPLLGLRGTISVVRDLRGTRMSDPHRDEVPANVAGGDRRWRPLSVLRRSPRLDTEQADREPPPTVARPDRPRGRDR